jgi:hypothetical protein
MSKSAAELVFFGLAVLDDVAEIHPVSELP